MALTQVTGTTNNGWDLVAGMNSSALTQLSRKFVPKSFDLTVNNDDYSISVSPSQTSVTVEETTNLISTELQISGTPQDGGNSFTGTTTIELDVSQVALNKITNKNYLQLDGSEMTYMSSTSADSFDSETGFTMEAWLQPNTKNTKQVIMVYGSGSTFSPMFSLNDSNQLELSWSSGSSQTSPTLSNIWDGNWHHVAVSVSSNSVTFYLDGLAQGSSQSIGSKLSGGGSSFAIGNIEGQSYYFNGNLTDIRVWDVARNSTQIQQYMNVDLEDDIQTGLIELWTFSGDKTAPVNKITTSQVGDLLGSAAVTQLTTALTSSVTYVNFLSTNQSTLQLKVTSDITFDGTASFTDAEFNTALTTELLTKVIPYAQEVTLRLNFGVFSFFVKPTHWNFTTISNSNTSDPYQLLGLSMFSNTVSPSTDDQSTVFANDENVYVPESGSNLIASFYDYRILNGIKNLLVGKLNLFSDDDFSISPSDDPVTLKLNPMQLFVVLRLSKFNFTIDSKGINWLINLCTPVINFDPTATLNAEAEEKSQGSLTQDVDLEFTEIMPNDQSNLCRTVALYTFLLVVILGIIGFLLLPPWGALIGVIVGVLLGIGAYYYIKNRVYSTIKPSCFSIAIGTLILVVIFAIIGALIAAASTAGVGAPVGALIGATIAFLIGVGIYIFINEYKKFGARTIHDKIKSTLEKFSYSTKFANPSFTINDIIYNQAVIVQGLYGNAKFNMSLENPDADNQIVYYNNAATLKIQLINNTGTAVTLESGTNATTISISMPNFLSNDLAGMSISLDDWTYTLEDSILTLTNDSATSWPAGSDDAITFEITGITSTYNKFATGFVNVNIINAYTNQIQLLSRLSNSTSSPPGTYTVHWEATIDESEGYKTITPSSGTAQLKAQSNNLVPITSTTSTDGTTTWNLGYRFNTNGLVAVWWAPDKSSRFQYIGQPYLTPESTKTTTVYPKGATTTNFTLKFISDNEE